MEFTLKASETPGGTPPTVAVDPEGPQQVAEKFHAAQEAATQGNSFTPTQEQVQSSMKDLTLHLLGDGSRPTRCSTCTGTMCRCN